MESPVPRERLVGLVFDDRYLTHNTGLDLIQDQYPYPFADPIAHPSSPELVGRAKHLMDLFGIAERMRRIDPIVASDEQLTVYHTPAHVARVAQIAQTDAGTPARALRSGEAEIALPASPLAARSRRWMPL
jgi:acetoin utilization deacetylase AcuC-like enzyme